MPTEVNFTSTYELGTIVTGTKPKDNKSHAPEDDSVFRRKTGCIAFDAEDFAPLQSFKRKLPH
jgi:hypothetical protein